MSYSAAVLSATPQAYLRLGERYATDFSEYTTGVQPSGWTVRWDGSNTTWAVREKTGTFRGKCLEHSSTINGRRLISWDIIDTLPDRADAEILVRWRPNNNENEQLRLHIRASGGTGTEHGYFCALPSPNPSILNLSRYVNGAASGMGSAVFAIVAGTRYWLRFRVVGDSIKVRAWVNGSAEPETWTVEATNGVITGAGWVGIGSYSGTSSRDIDYISVATGGATAPSPPASVLGPGIAYDLSGNSRNGTYVNIPGLDRPGLLPYYTDQKSVSFNGVNTTGSYVRIPNSSGALNFTGALSLKAVFQPNELNRKQAIVSNTHNGGYLLYIQQEEAVWGVRALVYRNGAYGEVFLPFSQIDTTKPIFSVVTYDGRYARLYINGVLQSTNDAGGNYPIGYSVNYDIFIAAEQDSSNNPLTDERFNGRVQEVALFNYALSGRQIKLMYNTALTGNYGLFKPVEWDSANTHADCTLYNFNTGIQNSGVASMRGTRANYVIGEGKWYWEVSPSAVSGDSFRAGVAVAGWSNATAVGATATSWGVSSNGSRYNNNTGVALSGFTVTANSRIMIAVDFNIGSIWFGLDGVWQGNPAAGTGAAYTGINTSGAVYPVVSLTNVTSQAVLYAGAENGSHDRDTSYSIPAGFSYLWDQSLDIRPEGLNATVRHRVMTLKNDSGSASTFYRYITEGWPVRSGKWAWEILYRENTLAAGFIAGFADTGLGDVTFSPITAYGDQLYNVVGVDTAGNHVRRINNVKATGSVTLNLTVGEWVMLCLDLDSSPNVFSVYKNNVQIGSWTFSSGLEFMPFLLIPGGTAVSVNYGGHLFVNDMPQGHQEYLASLSSNNRAQLNPAKTSRETLAYQRLQAFWSYADRTGRYSSRVGQGKSTGKWYWEVETVTTNPPDLTGFMVGLAADFASPGVQLGSSGESSWGFIKNAFRSNGSTVSAPDFEVGDYLRLAWDADAGTLQLAVNNGGFSSTYTVGTGVLFPVVQVLGGNTLALMRLGYRRQKYLPPEGYLSYETFSGTHASPVYSWSPADCRAGTLFNHDNTWVYCPEDNSWYSVRLNNAVMAGKYVWEVEYQPFNTASGVADAAAGVADTGFVLTEKAGASPASAAIQGTLLNSLAVNNSGLTTTYDLKLKNWSGQARMLALDMDAVPPTLRVYGNRGVLIQEVTLSTTPDRYVPVASVYGKGGIRLNQGQRVFYNPIPSGYSALQEAAVIDTTTFRISGTVLERGIPAIDRVVRIYRQDTGDFLGETTSLIDGSFAIDCNYSGQVYCIVLDDAEGYSYNALIRDRITPVQVT